MDEARVWVNLKALALEPGDIAKAVQAYETSTGDKPKAVGLHSRNAELRSEAEALGIPVIHPSGMLIFEVWLLPSDNFGTVKSALGKNDSQIQSQVSQNSSGIKHHPLPKRGRPASLDVPTDEIIRLSCEGLSVREIAKKLRLSRSTVHRTVGQAKTLCL